MEGNLRTKMVELVEENNDLSHQLKGYFRQALQIKEREKSLDIHSMDMENIGQRLALALEEKDTVEKLWKSSLKEVEALKDRVRHYQSGAQLRLTERKLIDAQKDYTEAIKILESKSSFLKAENDKLSVKCRMLEDQLMQVSSQMAIITENNLSLNQSLKEASMAEQQWKSRYLDLEAKFIELDRAYQADKVKFAHIYEYEKVESSLKERLEGALRQRDELQAALERCHERLAEQVAASAADRGHVAEAVALVEQAAADREQALASEAAALEEIKKLKNELNSLIEEAGLKVAREVAAVKKQCDSQLASLKDQLSIVEQECKRKRAESEQWQKECDRLQSLVQRHSNTCTTDKHMEQVFGEMQAVETDCQQLIMENEALREVLGKLQDRCRRNSRDKLKLKCELQKLSQQNELCQHELSVTTQHAELVSSQLNLASRELAQLQSEKVIHRENATNAQAKMSVATTAELYKQLEESYGQMNNKWKMEMNALTEKFEEKINKLKAKNKNHIKKDVSNRKHCETENHK